MKHFKSFFIVFLVVCLVGTSLGTVSAQTQVASASFVASEPDSQGNFTLSLNIYNAKFNTFQFVLRYDKATAIPVDSTGNETVSFFNFAEKARESNAFNIIGSSVDNAKGLIDFTGYLSPGSTIKTDNLASVNGYANIGSSGLKIFEFKFKKTGTANAIISIAEQSATKPYSTFLPEGAVLLDAGESIPMSVQFDLPSSVGSSSSVTPTKQEEQVVITKQERLRKTIALQIGNYGAAAEGALIHIDSENKNVMPYIDENDRTMVPVRFIAEQLGAKVEWNETEEKITITSGANTITMTVGSRTYTINGISALMDTAPVIRSGWNRTMVPIRFVTEALGMAVQWDSEHSMVFITEPDAPWQLERQAEKDAIDSILLVISPGMRDFI